MDLVTSGVDEEEEDCLILGGDLNAKTGKERGLIRESSRVEVKSRRSRDKIVNREEKILIDKIIDRRWTILNGSYEKEGDWTYIGEGASVIDYAIVNVEAEEEIKSMVEGNREEPSAYRGPKTGKGSRIKRRESERTLERNVWTEEAIEFYQKQCENWHSMEEETNKLWEGTK